jgi:UDP-N-acetylglucosamine--N-acetylmuramyl-(pentapeptide) pyrophosphoryl-undecaprenol N-acetylglucosamine transferase
MPALAIGEAIHRSHPEWRVVLVGATRGVEATILPTREYPFHLLSAEPIYRREWWRNLRWPFLAARLLREVGAVLDQENPAVVVGTGGYVAGPVLWRAARRGLPTAVLELNAYPGLATRWLARSAREIWLGAAEALPYLKPGSRTTVLETGAPVVPPDPARREQALRRFGLTPGQPVLLVTGGSQGALAINSVVGAWLDQPSARGLQILWATGPGTYPNFQRHHRPPAVQVFDFLDPMADAYAVANLALSRAGMMTISELCAWGIPSILVPLPTAAADHQTPNARALAEANAAIHLPQSELSAARLGELVSALLAGPDRLAAMAAAARSRGHPDAAERIATRIGVLSG